MPTGIFMRSERQNSINRERITKLNKSDRMRRLVSKRMIENNPMKSKKRYYLIGSLKSKICSCRHKKCSGSKCCMKCRKIELSSDQNPMKNPLIKIKFKISQRKTYDQEGYIHPNTGNHNEGVVRRMLTNNPMKNPTIAAKTSGERHWSHTKPERFTLHLKNNFDKMRGRGFISKGQQNLYDALNRLNIYFIPEHPVEIGKLRFFLDAYSPSEKIDWEFDGFYTHRENPRADKLRDETLLYYCQIKTIRIIPEDLPEIDNKIKEKLKCLNG